MRAAKRRRGHLGSARGQVKVDTATVRATGQRVLAVQVHSEHASPRFGRQRVQSLPCAPRARESSASRSVRPRGLENARGRRAPVVASHTATVPSLEPVATRVPVSS